jgi:tryptophan synthase alpha chain
MNRLASHFERNRRTGRKTLSLFLTAGFPSLELTPPLLLALQNSGADMIEVGIPFSDPIADGPIIQHSSEIALQNGTTLRKIFDIIGTIREVIHIPLLLMGYVNPIYSFGINTFLRTCSETGIDGVIIPDLSLEEGGEFRKLAVQYDIATILLVAPTTSVNRIKGLDNASTGFLYCVSMTGVTGNKLNANDDVDDFLKNVCLNVTKVSILVGFGISTPDDAYRMSSYCDGIVVGSALVKLLQQEPVDQAPDRASAFTRTLRLALDRKK